MGSSGSSESIGHLHLQIDSTTVAPNSTVSGTVHFKLNGPLTAQSLDLELRGEERCEWVEAAGRGIRRSGAKEFVCRVFPVFVFQGPVSAGDYSFPFAFVAPGELPMSCEIPMRHASATIEYQLLAFLRSQSRVPPSKVLLYFTQPLSASTPAACDLIAPIRSCCLSKGTVVLKASANKSAYSSGEAVEVEVAVDNSQCRVDVHRVVVALVRRLRLRNNLAQSWSEETTINRAIISRLVRAGEVRDGSELRAKIEIREVEGRVVPSLRGEKVECIYALEVWAETDGLTFARGHTPHAHCELRIYPQARPHAILPPPQPPVSWHPTVMPLVHLHSVLPNPVYTDEQALDVTANTESAMDLKAVAPAKMSDFC